MTEGRHDMMKECDMSTAVNRTSGVTLGRMLRMDDSKSFSCNGRMSSAATCTSRLPSSLHVCHIASIEMTLSNRSGMNDASRTMAVRSLPEYPSLSLESVG